MAAAVAHDSVHVEADGKCQSPVHNRHYTKHIMYVTEFNLCNNLVWYALLFPFHINIKHIAQNSDYALLYNKSKTW